MGDSRLIIFLKEISYQFVTYSLLLLGALIFAIRDWYTFGVPKGSKRKEPNVTSLHFERNAIKDAVFRSFSIIIWLFLD